MSGAQLLENFVTYIVDPAILVIFTAGFFIFVWGLVQFVLDLDKGANREQHIQHMIWGIVGMFVMASVYGILALLDNTFDLNAFSAEPDMSRFREINIPPLFR